MDALSNFMVLKVLSCQIIFDHRYLIDVNIVLSLEGVRVLSLAVLFVAEVAQCKARKL